jgi:hypothetical protein
MYQLLFLLAGMGSVLAAAGQPGLLRTKKQPLPDSARSIEWKELQELPVALLQESDRTEHAINAIPPVLHAGRDPFLSAASFHFSAMRFRLRGYDADQSVTWINGIQVNNPNDGHTPWGYWSGLNDVTRNTQSQAGLQAGEYGWGSIGSTTGMDMRAFRQREQTQFSYSFANRSYTHRWMFTHSRGMNARGWSFSFSGSYRKAANGYMPGSFYTGLSYYLGIDKKISAGKMLSLVFFGANTRNGKQSAVLKESVELAGTTRYNAYWGWQDGQKRNANTGGSHVPVLILHYSSQVNNRSNFSFSLAGMMGEQTATSLDWYNAPDPRPDYYRYLPGYQKDSLLGQQLYTAYREFPALLQINWPALYAINRNSYEITHDAFGIPGNSVGGLRSHYVIEQRINAVRRADMGANYHADLTAGIRLDAGAILQYQQVHQYKKIDDLLGGDYYVDWNQFAEGDASVIQNDLEHPNRILQKGDAYGYDYVIATTVARSWAQLQFSGTKTDLFVALSLGYKNYFRDGNKRNGLFPYDSYGRSVLLEFPDHALKAGISYKIDGRRYLYLHIACLSRPPAFDDVFLSPRTRNTIQESIRNEKIQSAEAGWIWHAPAIKMRITAYATRFSDGMRVIGFYHDGYRSFVNDALSGIGKLHMGIETGMDIPLSSAMALQLAANIGSYYYNTRQQLTVSIDNDAYVTERSMVYSRNFRIGGTPQQAWYAGVSYQSGTGLYMNLGGNFFRNRWLEFNPARRTYAALQHLQPGTDAWTAAINQEKLPDVLLLDFSIGNSWRIPTAKGRKRQMLLLHLSMGNLLNNRNLVTGGYEQLRFDVLQGNANKFPPKYYYAMGLNFSVNLTWRFS